MILRDDVLDGIYSKVVDGETPDKDEIIYMYDQADLNLLGEIAGRLARKVSGQEVSFVSNLILNYTNICNVRCKFCAFYRNGNEDDAYLMTVEQVVEQIRFYYEEFGVKQLLIQGGVNPNLSMDYYLDLFSRIRSEYPELGIHGLSTSEISFISRKTKLSIPDTLRELSKAGLQTIPGAGAEILDQEVRKMIGRPPMSGFQWLEIMEEAHKLGIKSSATMMFGHVENSGNRADHLLSLVELQSKHHGFLSFTPWNFEPGNTKLMENGLVKYRAGGVDILRNIAISRMALNNSIPIIQSSWLTNGIQMGQMAVIFGANDWGGTIYNEKVIPATGKKVGNLRKEVIINCLNQIGMIPVERDNMYRKFRKYAAE